MCIEDLKTLQKKRIRETTPVNFFCECMGGHVDTFRSQQIHNV